MNKLLLSLVALLLSSGLKAQLLSVNTDVLTGALQTPSIGVEMVTGERTTLGLNVMGNYRPYGRDIKLIAVQPEARYFFSGRPMFREFVGIGGVGSTYDITWKGKVYNGICVGVGLTFGYVISLSKRWNIDCHAGFGVIYYKQKEYFEGDRYDDEFSYGGVERTNATGYHLLPTRIGVSVSYIIK